MKTKLHGILTDLIYLWNHDGFLDKYADYSNELLVLMEQLETIVRPGTNPDIDLVDRDVWSELYAKTTMTDEELLERNTEFEGHPPGNDFEGEDSIKIMHVIGEHENNDDDGGPHDP